MTKLEPDRREEFWKKAEEKHGVILAYGMGQYASIESHQLKVPPMSKKKARIWGVSYITEKGIFLYRFPHQNWFASMLKMEAQEEMWVEIFFSSIEAWRNPKKASFWQGFFGNNDERLILITKNNNAKEEKANTQYTIHSFILDIQHEILLKLTANFFKNKQELQ